MSKPRKDQLACVKIRLYVGMCPSTALTLGPNGMKFRTRLGVLILYEQTKQPQYSKFTIPKVDTT